MSGIICRQLVIRVCNEKKWSEYKQYFFFYLEVALTRLIGLGKKFCFIKKEQLCVYFLGYTQEVIMLKIVKIMQKKFKINKTYYTNQVMSYLMSSVVFSQAEGECKYSLRVK